MGNRAVAAKRPTGRRVRCVAMLLAAMLAWTVPAAAGAPELVAQGERALRRGDLIGAMRAFREALAEEPGSWRARDGMGRAFRAAADLESAERELRQAVEAAPPGTPPARNLADMLLSLPDPRRRQEGLAWLADRAPGSVEIQLLVARQARRSGDFLTAGAALARLRRLRPDGKEAMVEEILLHRDALEYDRAEALALAFIERHPSYHQTHIQLGRIYRIQGRLDEAEAQYRRALELRPDEPTALTRLAEIRLEAGDLEEARNLLERAVVVRPDGYAAYYVLGRVHLLRGDRRAAEEAMRKFRDLKEAMRATARLAGGAAMVDE